MIYWIHTSDVHGNLDVLKGIEQYVKDLRSMYNVILTEGGDVLQGHPYVYYHNFIDTNSPHVVAETMNRMGYDCMALGNHDIEPGPEVYDRVFSQFSFPVLCANIEHGSLFKPYHVIEKDGLKIAVLSLVTLDTEYLLSSSRYEFSDPVLEAKRWIKKIKQEVDYDLLVGLFHMGWDEVEPLAKAISDFDLILYGHDHHQGIHKVGNTLCAAPSSLASSFVEVKIDTEKKSVSAELINTKCCPGKTHNPNYEAWLNKKIGTIDIDLKEFDSFFGPSAFLVLIHQLQLRAANRIFPGNNLVSLSSPVSYDASISKGTITNRDIFTLYDRESQLYIMKFSLNEIKGILEYSYSLWCNVMTEPQDHALLMDYLLDNGTRLCLKNFSINFLSAYGINYTVDLTKSYGEKITILESFEKPVLVCINSFYGNGGCEILTKGTGLTKVQLHQRIQKVVGNLRMCLADEISMAGDYHLKNIDNWRFVPENWAKSSLERDRIILSE